MSAILGQDSGPATNDVYGKMFYYVRSLCLKFQRRVRSLQVEFHVMHKDTMALPAIFNEQGRRRFDRIDVRAHIYRHIQDMLTRRRWVRYLRRLQ